MRERNEILRLGGKCLKIISFSVFKEQLVRGEKTQTIRKPRKRPLKEGELVKIVWKSRSKNRQELFVAKIVSIKKILFHQIDEEIARADGFNSLDELRVWFRKRYSQILPTDEFRLIKFRKMDGINFFLQEKEEKKTCKHDPVFREKKCPCHFMENRECLFDKIAAYARASNLRMFNRRSRAFRNKSRR